MQQINFYEAVKTFTASEEQLSKLSNLDLKTLTRLKTHSGIPPKEIIEIFGNMPVDKASSYWAMVRDAIEVVMNRKKDRGVMRAGNVFSMAWSAKLSVQPQVQRVNEIDIPVAIVIKASGEKIDTGTAPMLRLEGENESMMRAANLIGSVTKLKQDKVVPCDLSKLASVYKGIDITKLGPVVTVASALKDAIAPGEKGLSEVEWRQRALQMSSECSIESRVQLNNIIGKSVGIVREDNKKGFIPGPNVGAADKKSYDSKPIYVWSKPLEPKCTISKVANVTNTKDVNPLTKEVAWITKYISFKGDLNIDHAIASANLYPGLSRNESEAIRFITVGLPILKRLGKVVLKASSAMQMLFYFSAKSYLERSDEDLKKMIISIPDNDSTKLFLRKFMTVFDPSVHSKEHHVIWMPKKYSSLKNAQDTIDHNLEFYQDIIKLTSYTAYMEVFSKKSELHYYSDGLMDIFNVWATTESEPLSALTRTDKKVYGSMPLPKISNSISEVAYQHACNALALPFYMFNKRTGRPFVVQGSSNLVISEDKEVGLLFKDVAYVDPETIEANEYDHDEEEYGEDESDYSASDDDRSNNDNRGNAVLASTSTTTTTVTTLTTLIEGQDKKVSLKAQKVPAKEKVYQDNSRNQKTRKKAKGEVSGIHVDFSSNQEDKDEDAEEEGCVQPFT